MSSESVLSFEPQELSFQFELNKQLSTSLRLLNKTENHIIFKLFSTTPKKYGVLPNIGVLLPGSTCEIAVTKGCMRKAPHDMKCKDRFKIQTAIASPGTTEEDARSMFSNEDGHAFQECILRVVYVVPLPEVPLPEFPLPEVPLPVFPLPEVPLPLPLPSVLVEEPPETSTGSVTVSEVTESNIGPDEDAVQSDQTEFNAEDTRQQVPPGLILENDSYPEGELIIRGIIICLLGLLICYVMKHTLSVIWSLSMIIIVLMMKMLKELVSESVGDWIVKALVHIFTHIFLKRG